MLFRSSFKAVQRAAGGFGYPAGEIPQLGVKEFPADERLLALAEEACREANPDISTFKGRVASGDQFIDSKEKKNWIHDTFDAYCTEMEGAAVAQAAYLNKVPYLIVRAISDKADDSAHMDYGEFEAKAVEHSVNLRFLYLRFHPPDKDPQGSGCRYLHLPYRYRSER